MNFSTETSVKPLLRYIDWDHTLRNNLFTGESNSGSFPYTHSTWSQSKIDKCRENYLRRIQKGKIKIFYVDLVKHTVDEMSEQIDKGPKHMIYDKERWINKVNRHYRLCAYYDAIIQLAPNYNSP